jgi:SAM-dependent methyltransferase
VLADIVGPAGHVVGVDSNPAAVQRGRAVVSALELGNADLVAGDLHDLDSAALGGPFDLAFTRCFLVHQADPVRTLRHIAGLLRPGGLVVAQEPLRNPGPRAHPHIPALAEAWDLIQEVRDRAGLPAEAVESLPRAAREAGLEVAALHGFFVPSEDPQELDGGAALVTATKERGVQLGIAADRFDDLTRQIQAAKATHEWMIGAFFFSLTLRKPAEA